MAQTYAYIREQCVAGVMRNAASLPRNTTTPPPLDRIRAQFDAAFFSINSQTAQAYAAQEQRRELLRQLRTLTFDTITRSGSRVTADVALPTDTLKAYISDGTLTVNSTDYGFRRYPDWLRGGDPRVGIWTQVGDTLYVKATSILFPASVTTGDFSSIESPPVPATEDAEFLAPDDFVPDFIAACVQYILGETMEVAAQTA